MSYENFNLAVGGLILRGDKVLLNHRTDYDMWDLPSGGVEKNETIIQALKREIKEETGLNVKPVRLVGVYHNYRRKVISLLFLVKVISGKLRKNEEADDHKYFSYKKLPKNTVPKQKERIINYFNNKKEITVATQKSKPSYLALGFKK